MLGAMSVPARIPLLLLFASGACTRADPPPSPAREPPPPPQPISVRDGQADLLFSYRAPGEGRFRTATTAASIPLEARASVVVMDLSLSPEARGSTGYVHVVDLREPGPDGLYPVAVASRHAFARGSSAPGSERATSRSTAPVVMYSASWCGVCKKAKRVLGDLGVRFEEKDIEASRSALEELSAKAQQAGLRPSGVPVIDVKGRLMQGLDVPRLKEMLRKEGLLDS